MRFDPTRSVVGALLSGLVLSGCGGIPGETGLEPAGAEALGTQESALDCAGAAVTSLNMGVVSSWGGTLSTGSGTWSVVYPANGIILEYYVDGVLRGTQPILGDANRSGTWTFNDSPVACGSHTFEVRGYPAVFDSATPAPGRCTTGSMVKSTTFSEACPTAAWSCSRTSTTTITCTASGSGGTGGPFTAFWSEIEENNDTGAVYQTGWYQGPLTNSFFCPQKTNIQYPYNGDLTIKLKMRDANGLESAVLSRSYICVF
ncbi:MAG TPA: hypothetical protein VFZ09_00790 [Archangium sp.]|uniref:hypothetical protein n=1 Tax=Archangium sp. TaxID=1872627 RepID=UPI002E37D939|nr:hypothetical protein [Archangium sp.]HEX5744743.1 hypothetical protein [Archangium sp.]